MAGAGEALSSTSELFTLRNATFLTNPENCGIIPDEAQHYRQQHEEPTIETPRDTTLKEDATIIAEVPSTNNITVLEDDHQSDTGYGTSECASELRGTRRVQSDSNVVTKN